MTGWYASDFDDQPLGIRGFGYVPNKAEGAICYYDEHAKLESGFGWVIKSIWELFS